MHRNGFRRTAVAMGLALGVLLFSAGGAGAAVQAPKLAAAADSTALEITLTIPGTEQLRKALVAAGVPLQSVDLSAVEGALPDEIRKGIVLTQRISMTNSSVAEGKASGVAQSLSGLVTLPAASTAPCAAAKCTGAEYDRSTELLRLKLLEDALPGGADLGTIEVAGARSRAWSNRDVSNETALVKVHLGLGDLLAMQELAPVKDALSLLTAQINDVVIDTINPVLADARAQLDAALNDNGLENVNEVLKSIVTLGDIKRIPDVSTTDLLDVTVLGATSEIVRKGSVLSAHGESKVADVRVLGDWLTIGSVLAEATSTVDLEAAKKAASIPTTGTNVDSAAKSVLNKLQLSATRDMKLTNVNLGGLLQLHSPELALINDAAYKRLRAALQKDAPAGFEDTVGTIVNALDVLYTTAGVKLERVTPPDAKIVQRTPLKGTKSSSVSTIDGSTVTTQSGEAGLSLVAQAKSDYLKLTVEPKIPVFDQAQLSLQPGTLPTPIAYESTGLKLEVRFPQANTYAAQGAAVLGFNIARTGIGVSWIAAALLIGSALTIKRFALSR